MQLSQNDIVTFRGKILKWYDENRRDLPWRMPPGTFQDPYKVWLSEIMLQQTTVQTVIPYYRKFIEKWPDVHSLAAADADSLMQEWAGLGYYARARNLHACAREIVQNYGGVFPDELRELKALPGIGDYTAAAILSIAFDKPAVVVDGNIERIMARYFNIRDVFPVGKKVVIEKAKSLSQDQTDRCGDYAQALMDIGAGVCTPRSPKCAVCPIAEECAGRKSGDPEKLPVKAVKEKIPVRYGHVYIIKNSQGDVLIEKRQKEGLLGGMYGFPTGEWVSDPDKIEFPDFLVKQICVETGEDVTHTFTHFHLRLKIVSVTTEDFDLQVPEACFWTESGIFHNLKFPTVFEKVRKFF